jgi:hypothetical protein
VGDCDRDRSNDQHRGEETELGQEQPLAPRFDKPVLIDLPQPDVGNDHAKTTENRGNQDRKDPKAAVRPEHCYFDLGTPIVRETSSVVMIEE